MSTPDRVPEIHETPDEWHRHTTQEARPQAEHGSKINGAILGLTFLVIFAGLAVTIGVITVYYFSYVTKVKAERMETTVMAEESYARFNTARSSENSYRWATVSSGELVLIPMDRAIEQVVSAYADR